jgi:putative intracellular protease/amidase
MNTETPGGKKPRILAGKRIAFLVADGFEQFELAYPRYAVEELGARVEVLALA